MKKFEKSRNRGLDIEKSWDRSSRHTHTLDEYDWNSYSEARDDVGAQRGRDWRPMSEREMQPDAPTCNLR